MKVVVLLVVLAVSVYGKPFLAPLHQGLEGKRIPGRYIFTLKDGSLQNDLDNVINKVKDLAEDNNLDIKMGNKYNTINMFVAEMNEKALTMVRSLREIAFVEEDSIFSLSAVSSWGLDRIDQVDLPLDDTFTPRGTGAGVNVYIVDTGIRFNHTDFNGRAIYFHDSLGGDGEDCNGHGSHCAGTSTGNSYGVAKSATVNAVRVMSCVGFGSTAGIIDGIEHIRLYGQKPAVVSMSIGGSPSPSLDNSMNYLKSAGYTIVVAAGNSNADACTFSPARSTSVITVGATNSIDRRAVYSNYGVCLDIFAPGTRITSAWATGDDASIAISGTSMACPHVAGAAAVLLGNDPTMSHDEVKKQLLAEASVGKIQEIGDGSPNLLLYIG
ncbi:aqualysin-1-like [Glandiceps talaboti]